MLADTLIAESFTGLLESCIIHLRAHTFFANVVSYASNTVDMDFSETIAMFKDNFQFKHLHVFLNATSFANRMQPCNKAVNSA